MVYYIYLVLFNIVDIYGAKNQIKIDIYKNFKIKIIYLIDFGNLVVL